MQAEHDARREADIQRLASFALRFAAAEGRLDARDPILREPGTPMWFVAWVHKRAAEREGAAGEAE